MNRDHEQVRVAIVGIGDCAASLVRETITESDGEPVDVAQVLRDTRADVLVSQEFIRGKRER